jgi:ribonucleotide reductase alpha subunit
MKPSEVILPENSSDLIRLYILINEKINDIWKEYVVYTDLKYVPATTKIFAIIFSEMDFYETLLSRIRVHLSEEDMLELRKHDAFWDW